MCVLSYAIVGLSRALTCCRCSRAKPAVASDGPAPPPRPPHLVSLLTTAPPSPQCVGMSRVGMCQGETRPEATVEAEGPRGLRDRTGPSKRHRFFPYIAPAIWEPPINSAETCRDPARNLRVPTGCEPDLSMFCLATAARPRQLDGWQAEPRP